MCFFNVSKTNYRRHKCRHICNSICTVHENDVYKLRRAHKHVYERNFDKSNWANILKVQVNYLLRFGDGKPPWAQVTLFF